MRNRLFLPLLASALLVACGGDKAQSGGRAAGDENLPKPGAVSGSVTGMPEPGSAGPSRPVAEAVPIEGAGVVAGESNTDPALDPLASPDAMGSPQEAPQALAVLRDYYAAINARDFARAYAQWSDQGRASGQSLQQFADGFADTDGVSVQLGAAGPVEGAAGSRYIEIPATVDARQRDGRMQRYAGTFTLRMTVVDGAMPAQRIWHIAAADLREVGP